MKVTIFDNLTSLYKKSADTFVDFSNKAIKDQGRFTVALSGGSSPKAIFELLATKEYEIQVEWDKVFIFWVDER